MTQCQFKKLEIQDLPRLNHFLKQHKEAKASKGDLNYWLTNEQGIIACARLLHTENEDVFWLRGVYVDVRYRKQGLGSQLINAIHATLSPKQRIIAFPLGHLQTFYGQLGYKDIEPERLPENLQQRFTNAEKQNKQWLCMAFNLNY